jgi:hypothetical protein
MTYSVGNSEVANYANTSSGKVTNVVADNGVGGSGESVNVVDRVALSFVISVNVANAVVDVTSVVGYIAGKSDITVTVDPNVYVYGVVPTNVYSQSPDPAYYNDILMPYAGLEIVGGASGDTIKLVNNGYITGYGGDGSGMAFWETICCCSGYNTGANGARTGGAALSFVTPGINLVIENNGYIAGGGGGGGAGVNLSGRGTFGGGGAGGGICYGFSENKVRATPTSPTGLNGGVYSYGYDCVGITMYQGGGGGFTFPGVGGALGSQPGFAVASGVGGGSGGGGAISNYTGSSFTPTNNGGSGNTQAGDTSSSTAFNRTMGGGGGGWGAAGGSGYVDNGLIEFGASGGYSIITNGNAYTMLGDGNTRLWGTVSTTLRTVVYTFPTTTANAVLDFINIPQFSALPIGLQVVLIVPANVTLYSLNPTMPGLKIGATTTRNCNVRLIVNGNILGMGGTGGGENTLPSAGGYALQVGSAALLNTFPLIIDNQVGYIGGGGGGGGLAANNANYSSATRVTYGGGGAGGGASGAVGDFAYNARITALNTNGNNGTSVVNGIKTYSSGGTGGTIVPGARTNNTGTFTGGVSYPGLGGQAGGSGAFYNGSTVSNPTNYGGAFGENGNNSQTISIGNQGCAGGGGGGWGAAGGQGRQTNQFYQSGAAGGYSIVVSDYGSGAGNIWVGSSSHLGGGVVTDLV